MSVARDSIAVRSATAADGERCAQIYAPYVSETAITFELDPPDAAEMARRIASAQRRHRWLVAEREGAVAGYAYGADMHARAAYRWSCEVSVYVDRECTRSGVGRALYAQLLAALAERGFRAAIAGMTLPNEASERLHAAMGFEEVGVYSRIGYKLGSWHDVAWMQRRLGDGPDPPAETI